ncbi:MAG: GNAT family N-acetyltransferase [Ignavibacteria bacterium]|jgi:RimJ/RimL family protein N-acetyltransferase
MVILKTSRLILRKLTSNDTEFIVELLNEPSFIKYIGDKKVRTTKDAEKYLLHGPIKSYEQHGFGLYLVELKETNEPAGVCGLIKREHLDNVDIGFAFLKRFNGKGFVTESAKAVLDYGKSEFGLKRIVAITQLDNMGSIRVLEKIGMSFEKLIRLPDEDKDLKLYSVSFNSSIETDMPLNSF